MRTGAADPVELVEAALARIAGVDGEIGAFVSVDAARARAEAERCREQLRRAPSGWDPGVLFGVPFAVKDLFDVAGELTRGGSAVPPGPPAARDAVAVARMRAAGAVLVGRTRTHEFAWGITTRHPELGGTRNPHDPSRIAGGSSGGSAAAVAAGMVPVALGTDTGASLRLPAAFCGLVAHKPTHGLVPLDGVLPLAPSLDSGGALVRTVADARLLLELLSGAVLPPSAPVTGLRVGVAVAPGVPLGAAVGAVLDAAATRLGAMVADVRQVELPLAGRSVQSYLGVQAREALRWHRASGRWPQHADAYGSDVRGRLAAAEAMGDAELDEADQLRRELRQRMSDVFSDVDLLLLPVAGCGPSTVERPDEMPWPADEGQQSGRQHDERQHGLLREAVLPWTVPANLGGWPACAVPSGRDADGLPVGLQILGPAGLDARVLDLAAELALGTG